MAPFAVMNRTVNPLVRAILRSPAHGLLSRRVMLITVTGRRSGRSFTFPVQYRHEGARITIGVGAPESKRWWRNLRGGAPVTVEVRRIRHPGTAWARGSQSAGVTVEVELDDVAAGHGISPG